MRLRWLSEWWYQLSRKPEPDPWNEDPEILAARDRQHREGVTDAVTYYRNRDRFTERMREAWRGDDHQEWHQP